MDKLAAQLMRQQGSLSLIVAIFMVVLLTGGMVMIKFTSTNKQTATNFAQSTKAFYMTDGALHRALEQVRTMSPFDFVALLQQSPEKINFLSGSIPGGGSYAVELRSNFDDQFINTNAKGVITIAKTMDVSFEVITKQLDIIYWDLATHKIISYGHPVDVRFQVSLDSGVHWKNLFGGKWIDSGDVDIFRDVSIGAKLMLRGITDTPIVMTTMTTTDSVLIFKNGDVVPNILSMHIQSTAREILRNQYVDASGVVRNIPYADRLYLFEFNEYSINDLNSLSLTADQKSTIDYQDAIIVVRFDPSRRETSNFTLRATGSVQGARCVLTAQGEKSYYNDSLVRYSWKE
ncbi:MAG: hypothetical protein JW795_08635 [Chitinivibrionales bacterium]|nr:hypothetical protein [Chitinivibrionales bacterium]